MISILGSFVTTSAATYDETIQQAQKKLKELGYDPGPIDGLWGRKTETAVKKFQQEHSLSVTGKFDKETQEKLGLLEASDPQETNQSKQIQETGSVPTLQEPIKQMEEAKKKSEMPNTSAPQEKKDTTGEKKKIDPVKKSKEKSLLENIRSQHRRR